jgi:hypothetical protein
MNPFESKQRKNPERKIQDAIIKELRYREWLVKETHGNMYQSGFPDLFAAHRSYGSRWIEVKNPKSYSFTPAQMEWFPKFAAVQCGIWILTSSEPGELAKLMGPPNWHHYLKGLFDCIST